ncbi:hypothetical protein RvY_10968 [Ramazzottius varieornatus]|uniref:Uncharacterized protein n=1 Tax=Ramazzottius varieornatus TaxID=947166 RepID=A0A1D1VEI7_RAMVA|nr:hypothetical protein RvY_10968 [Ramazzottius varieornatus]
MAAGPLLVLRTPSSTCESLVKLWMLKKFNQGPLFGALFPVSRVVRTPEHMNSDTTRPTRAIRFDVAVSGRANSVAEENIKQVEENSDLIAPNRCRPDDTSAYGGTSVFRRMVPFA